MTGKPMIPKFSPNAIYYTDKVCPTCHGKKYSSKHDEVKLQGVSIGQLMCTPFSDIDNWLRFTQKVSDSINLEFSFQKIINFVVTASSLNLNYLYFNRTIPSLSGGELQRIKLVQVFNTQLADVLIILDEPLAGLSFSEKKIVQKKIESLATKHSLLIIDHNNIFYDIASNIITLGEGSGKNGGQIINTKEYIETQKKHFDFHILNPEKVSKIKIINTVYNYSGIDIEIAENRLNLITGRSGVGKSTLLREYLPQHFENYTYINQKPLVGNSNSSVATALDIFSDIVALYAKKFNKNKLFFSNHTGAEGACTLCHGAGKILYGSDYQDNILIDCKECDGTGFSKKLMQFKIDNSSIFDVWKMTIDEALLFLNEKKIYNTLIKAQSILLGHLVIGQQTSTLSGGENIRIKILKSLKSNTLVYGIDEPFRGLNNVEIYQLVNFFANLVEDKKTIIVADHEEDSFRYFSSHMVLNNKSGILCGNDYNTKL